MALAVAVFLRVLCISMITPVAVSNLVSVAVPAPEQAPK
jgi:hypothetical protein